MPLLPTMKSLLAKLNFEHVRALVETLAYILGGSYFAFQWISGYLATNLSLEIVTSRIGNPESDRDRLKITLVLTKGDKGSVHLFNIGVRVNDQPYGLMDGIEHYWITETDAGGREIDWGKKDLHYVNLLNPGERTEVSMVCDIDRSQTGDIQAVVVGRRKLSRNVKQWRASAKSLPRTS
jgi:hypothetical protein